jgi:glutaredoxin
MTILMYGTAWCSDCKRAKQFFGEQRVSYDFIDVDADPAGRAVVQQHTGGKDIIPTILFDDGSVLVEPSNAGSPPARPADARRALVSTSSARARPASRRRCTPPARAWTCSSSSAAGSAGRPASPSCSTTSPASPRA